MNEMEKMEKGLLYDPGDRMIMEAQLKALLYLDDFNQIKAYDHVSIKNYLPLMLGKCGENCFIQPPFYANWGGKHLFMGDNVYCNFGLTLVDDGHIYLDDDVMIGPHVTLTTANHPIDKEDRKKGLQYVKDIHIKKNAWLGANVVVLPGITIGENCVIGAGSIVTRDMPDNSVCVGNPCRVMRYLDEE